MTRTPVLHGAGLGLRRVFLEELHASPPAGVAFFEVAPENWMRVGGRAGRLFRDLTERHTFVGHGLSLSLGGPDPLDTDFLGEIRNFLDHHGMCLYSEHLSYCGSGGLLYDLMPLPFTEEAIRHTAARIRMVQDILERPIAIENISYYATPGQEMSEIDFLNAVLAEADCLLLLDVNNAYVNGCNHGYDPREFLQRIPGQRLAYAHTAGHLRAADDLIIDTHGADVIDPVWTLLEDAYARHGVFPTLLERDFNIPPLPELLREVDTLRAVQEACAGRRHAHAA